MIEHSAQFNLFDHVCVNNERTGVIVDFDFIAKQMREINQPISGSVSETRDPQKARDSKNDSGAVGPLSSDDSIGSRRGAFKSKDEVRVEVKAKNRGRHPAQMHLSSVNQFISAEIINQVDESQIEDQVYYWVLCEHDDNAVMAFVPEDLVTCADIEPSPKLLENLNAWFAQTNIQYQH